MAAPVRRLLERMIFRQSTGAVCVSAADGWRPSPRCYATPSYRSFSGGAAEKSTHFGFETVPESEKAKKGESTANFVDNAVELSSSNFVNLSRRSQSNALMA